MALFGVVAWGEWICKVGWGDLCDCGNLATTLDRARQRGSTVTIARKPTHRETWKRKTNRERCSHLMRMHVLDWMWVYGFGSHHVFYVCLR
jgi:hypothetical protein